MPTTPEVCGPEVLSLRQPRRWNASRIQHDPQEVAGVGRWRTDRADRPKGNP